MIEFMLNFLAKFVNKTKINLMIFVNLKFTKLLLLTQNLL